MKTPTSRILRGPKLLLWLAFAMVGIVGLISCGGEGDDANAPDPTKCNAALNPMLDCRHKGCEADQSCVTDAESCFPGACTCDAASGDWLCTSDCNAGYTCQASGSCPGTNPSIDCQTTGCESGECLLDEGACRSSSCVCDETNATWMCTADCGPAYTCQEPAPTCDEPDPSIDCRTTGCDDDQECRVVVGGCLPSSCFCEPEGWICTEDCGELHACQDLVSCDGPDPSLDCTTTGCADNEECVESMLPACRPSSCQCDETGWSCTDDCNSYNVCEPADTCQGPNPAGCTQDRCAPGFVCERDDNECAPSFCGCNDGVWTCTRDCAGGGECVPAPTECEGPNPAGCTQDGCEAEQQCRPTDECAPSACGCENGEWMCTRDCGGGGVCVDAG